MWGLLGLSPWRVAVAIGWGVLALGSGLALAALAAWLIARAWQMPPVLYLSVAVTAVRALGISRGLCRYLERLATHDVALRAMTSARTTVYRTLAQSDIWWRRDRVSSSGEDGRVVVGLAGKTVRVGSGSEVDAPASDRSGSVAEFAGDAVRGGEAGARELRRGEVLVRVGADIDDLGAMVVRVLVPVAVAVILSLAAVGLIAVISVTAAVILAVALAVSGMLAPWLSGVAAQEAERAVRADRAEFTAEAMTVLDHAAELRVAGRLDAALAQADRASRRAVDAEDAAASRSAWAAAATPLSIGVSAFGALLVGIAAYGPTGGLSGGMTPMALTILVLVPLSAFEAVAALPAAATTLTTSRAALHRLRSAAPDVTESTAAGGALTPDGPAAGRVASVVDRAAGAKGKASAVVGGAAPTVRAVPEIALPEGRRVAVVGPSGAGKTTLLMAWAGLFGTPRDGVTFFAEDAHLFGTSILENLRVARGDITDAEAENTLRAVGLGPWLDTLQNGVHTGLTAGAAAVSGGQRRRILLARALLAPAHTLLLDEPTEHLAAAEGEQLLRDLLDADSGLVAPDRTVVVVTHQLPTDHHADTVVTVDPTGTCHITHPAARPPDPA
ncbi:thiol reductant ABC exporter subunit CydC [Nocardia mangyaensis]|uniref:thiol reductant ABC exporter subunit CydC n=1 Tax=Nocardia mangyaensis TaxID=2213200 RepID=UPI0026772D4B|nr:thiol reductant ABC exporter subunit CydC [Nocardia mangyaensis]MDO3650206.1 thiol reductant ABC exporter subunit CydC [Nocardia mangyaensis]